MITWYIERIPAAGGAPDIRTLDGWGVDSATITAACWADGGATLALPSESAGSTAPAWSHLDHLVVWAGNPADGGARRAHLWVLLPGHHADPQSEAHQYKLVGPWWWLEVTQFFYPLTISDITTDPETGAATGCTWHMRHGTEVVWTSWADQSSGTIKGQLHRALYCAIDNDAPIAIGAIDIPGLAPALEQQGLTCADVITRAARYSPRASQWWDMSGATPVFRAASLANRPTASLAVGADSQSWDIAPRHDLRIDVVRVGYQWDNNGTTAAWYDIAGDNTLKDGAHTLRSLVDCPDSSTAANAASHFGVAAQLYAALHSTPYTGAPVWWGDAAGVLAVHSGHALNLTGGLSAWATMGAPIASVALTITSAAEDSLQITLGLPPSLGANDLFELYNLGLNLGTGAVATTGGTTEPAPDSGELPGGSLVDALGGLDHLAANGSGGLTWRYKELTCTHCGYIPYDGIEDTPLPLRYRTETPSGTVVRRDYATDHTTLLATRTDTPIGPRTWDGCTAPTTSLWQRVQTAGGACNAGTTGIDEPPSTAAPTTVAHLVRTVTNTCGAIGSGNGCCGNALGNCGIEYCGGATRTLSNPDTDAAARARAEAGAEWSEWSGTAVAAAYEQRTGLSFALVLEQYRGAWSGYQPGWHYRVVIDTETIAYTATDDVWTAGESITHDLVADPVGALNIPATELSCSIGLRRRPSTVHAPVPLAE